MLTEGGLELNSCVDTSEFSEAPSDNQAIFAFSCHGRRVRHRELPLYGLLPAERVMSLPNNQKRKPKAALHQTVRNVAQCREILGLPLLAVEYLRYAAESVSPEDVQNARTPWCYERVDDIAYALACGPREVHKIESRLVALGLVEKHTLANGHRHARRCRKTGELLWVHGISLKPLIERRDELEALATNRADINREYRATRQQVNNLRARLKDALAAADEYPALADLRGQMWAIYDAAPGRVTYRLYDLDALLRLKAELALAVDTLVEALNDLDMPAPKAGDNCPLPINRSDASDLQVRHKYLTTSLDLYFCNNAEPPNGGKNSYVNNPSDDGPCLEWECAGGETVHNPQNCSVPQITPRKLLDLAPERWRDALDGIEQVDWTVIGFVATARRAELGVSESAWRSGIDCMGPKQAAICLAILDTNQTHPTKPVRSVGGAFVAMTRRAKVGGLNLAPSIQWIAARRAGVVPAASA